jgi:ligand-binding sensor domain-containing protein
MPLLFASCSRTCSLAQGQRDPVQHIGNGSVAGHRLIDTYDRENSGLRVKSVYVIFQDVDRLFWIGGDSSLDRFDAAANKWTSSEEEGGDDVKSVHLIGQSEDKKLWFATGMILGGRLVRFDGKRWETLSRDSNVPPLQNTVYSVNAIFPGRGGNLWFSVGASLFAYDKGRWVQTLDVSSIINRPLRINAAIEDREGHIWLTGPPDNILRIDPTEAGWVSYSKPDGIRSVTHVRCMYQDRDGRIWFGGSDGIVASYDDRVDRWRTFDLHTYLGGDSKTELLMLSGGPDLTTSVRMIYQDRSGQMMFLTPSGLVVSSADASRWDVFGADNSALPSNNVYSVLEDNVGRIWLGTSKGIVVLEP